MHIITKQKSLLCSVSLIILTSLVFSNSAWSQARRHQSNSLKIVRKFFTNSEWGNPIAKNTFKKPNSLHYRINVDGLQKNKKGNITFTSHLKIVTQSGQVALYLPNIVEGTDKKNHNKYMLLTYKIRFDKTVPVGVYFAEVEVVDRIANQSIVARKKIIVQ